METYLQMGREVWSSEDQRSHSRDVQDHVANSNANTPPRLQRHTQVQYLGLYLFNAHSAAQAQSAGNRRAHHVILTLLAVEKMP